MSSHYDELSEMLRIARQSHALGELSLAESLYKEALVDHPGSHGALIGYAQLKIQSRDFSVSDDLLDILLQNHPECPDAHYLKSLIAYQAGDLGAARRYLEQATAFRPDFYEAHHLLAKIDLGGPFYRDVLEKIHRIHRPRTYLEIGIDRGKSLALAKGATRAIGIDPNPRISHNLFRFADIHSLASDEFFKICGNTLFYETHIDLAFIDGQHQAEQAFRDFLNCEKFSKPDSIILVHDVVPMNALTAEPQRQSFFWSGDIWKIIVAMKAYFPDLLIETFDCPPTGLAMIRRLNPQRGLSAAKMGEIFKFMRRLNYNMYETDKQGAFNIIRYAPETLEAALPTGDPVS